MFCCWVTGAQNDKKLDESNESNTMAFWFLPNVPCADQQSYTPRIRHQLPLLSLEMRPEQSILFRENDMEKQK
jgi:hypothetical protein